MTIHDAKRLVFLIQDDARFQALCTGVDPAMKEAFGGKADYEMSQRMIEGFVCEAAAELVQASNPVMNSLDKKVIEDMYRHTDVNWSEVVRTACLKQLSELRKHGSPAA